MVCVIKIYTSLPFHQLRRMSTQIYPWKTGVPSEIGNIFETELEIVMMVKNMWKNSYILMGCLEFTMIKQGTFMKKFIMRINMLKKEKPVLFGLSLVF
jgi:hypothetical protein